MKKTWMAFVAIGGVAAAYGCGGGSSAGPSQGGEGQSCYPNDTCNAGLTCLSHLCANAGGDGGVEAGEASDGGGDSASPADAASDVAMTSDASDGGTFVKSLPNLVLWLDGAKGITTDSNAHVTKWADQSGQGDDASYESGLTPSTVWPTAVNGLPAVDSPPGALLRTSGSPETFNGDFLLEFVAIVPTAGPSTPLVGSNAAAYDFGLYTSSGGCALDIFDGLGPIGTFTVQTGLGTSPHLFRVQRSNGMLDARIDGASDLTMAIGASYSFTGVSLYAGTFAEVVAINGTTSASDLAGLESYLKTKYGL